MPDKWDQYAVPAKPAPDKWDQYAVPQSPTLDQKQGERATDALVYSNMTGAPPSYTYENRDAIHKDFTERLGEYAAAGWKGLTKDSIIGEWMHGQISGPFANDDEVSKFIEGFGQMIGDLPAYLAGGGLGALAGGAAGTVEAPVVGTISGGTVGFAAGGFGLTAGLRQWLVDKYNGKQISAFSEVMDVLKATGKGALTGVAFGAAGEVAPLAEGTVAKVLGPRAYKTAAELATMTTVGAALEGRVPTAHDFGVNAALLAAMHVGTLGVGAAKDYMGKTYVDSGVHPRDAVGNPDGVPPPVEQADDATGMLRPAIKTGDNVEVGEKGEHHQDILDRMTPEEVEPAVPEGMTRLYSGNRVPGDQEGEVWFTSNRQYALDWNESHGGDESNIQYVDVPTKQVNEWVDPDNYGQTVEKGFEFRGPLGTDVTGERKPLYPAASSEPDAEAEHGFVDPQGRYLNRQDARKWVDENEPQVAANLEESGAGELTTEDYNDAQPTRNRAPSVPAPNAEVSSLRKELTKVREGAKASKFGAALRTFFVGNRDARIAETNQLADSLRKEVPDYRDQEALTFMRDFKNNPEELRARRDRYESGDNEKLKKLVPIIDRALNPTPEMLRANDRLTEYFTKRLDEGKRLGFIDSTVSNEEYIPHLLKPETDAVFDRGTSAPQIGRRFGHAKERKYETVLDALETGTVKGRTLNALDALTIYGQKHATVAATKILENELKTGEMGKWGTKRADIMPSDWVELAPGSRLFRRTVPYIDRETGEATLAETSLMVPKEVRDAMAPIIEGANVTGIPGFQKLKVVQGYIKAAELGLSAFHMKALSVTAMNNMGLEGLMRSMRSDMESQAFKDVEQDGIRAGLQTPILGRTVEAYRALTKETLPDRRNVIDWIRGKPGFKQLDDLAAGLTHATFDIMQRKFKVMDYATKSAAWMAKHPEASGDELIAAKRGIAKEVNAAYGGLNWEVLGASKTFRNWAQMVLLAPDWTFSNFFNAKYAFEGGPAGAAARSFWIRSFATGFAATQAMSILVSGQMSKHPSEVYLGKDKQGREIYSNMFFAGAPKDMITLINNVEDFGAVEGLGRSIESKLSPAIRGGIEAMTNRDYMGRQITTKGKGALTNTAVGAWHIASQAAPVPLSVTNVGKMLTDDTRDYGFWDYASVVGGTPPRHELPPGAKAQRKASKKKFSIRGAFK